jgi:hypothetical protein
MTQPITPVEAAVFVLKAATIALIEAFRELPPLKPNHYSRLVCVFVRRLRTDEDETQLGKPNTAKYRKRKDSRQRKGMDTPNHIKTVPRKTRVVLCGFPWALSPACLRFPRINAYASADHPEEI